MTSTAHRYFWCAVVIQSIEVGLDELQEATVSPPTPCPVCPAADAQVKRRPEVTPFGALSIEPLLRAFHALSFHPTTQGGSDFGGS